MLTQNGPSTPLFREYTIHAVLGAGGFGKVYLARDRLAGELERYTALKVLRLDAPLSYQERFRDEATILALLDHPSFVKVHALFRLDGHWCIDMEYVRGVTVQRLMELAPSIPVAPALEIISQVAQALDLAWSHPGPGGQPLNVLHRDIKPSNLILTRSGVVKVLDFGIARWQSAPRRATPTESRLPASVGYMAPERYGFKSDFGAEADIYALGVVLWEMLVGAPYLRPGSLMVELTAEPETFLPHAAKQREMLASRAPPEVCALVNQMLAWDPARRPTAAEVARDVQQLLVSCGGSASWRLWLESQIVPIVRQQQPTEERDGLCGRIVRSDALPIPQATPGQNTFLPLTGLQDPDAGPFTSALASRGAGPTSLWERTRQNALWIVIVTILGILAILGSAMLADADGDGARAFSDCDDQAATRTPDAEERCDAIDNDCDDQIDEDLARITLYLDADGDGVGTSPGVEGCAADAPGYASRDGDCDDQDPRRAPDLIEIPGNGLDDDCDGLSVEARPASPSRPSAPSPTPAQPPVTAPASPAAKASEAAAPTPTGQVKLIGAGVQGDLYDRSGSFITTLRAGNTRSVPPGVYRAVLRSELISGVELGPFEVSADESVLIDCSMPLMGQLCAIK